MKELDFEVLFKFQMAGMKFNQCHPDTKINKYWLLKNFLTLGPYTMYFILLVTCIKYYVIRNDFFNAFRTSVPVTFYICMMLYFCLLIANRSTMGSVIKKMKLDYTKTHVMDSTSKATVLEYTAKGVNIMNLWGLLMISSVIVFMSKSIALTIYHTHKKGELTLIPFHEMRYPLNITEIRKHNILVFAATFVGETFFTSMSALIYFSTVPLGPIFILHACGQLELIKKKFENIFEKDNVDELLTDIVQNLQYVYSFVQEINDCFTLIYEILLKQTMILLPFTGYAIIQSISYGELTIEYVCIFMESLFTSSIPCYYGDLLIQKGEEVRLMAYSCGWEYVHTPRARKTLMIILTRALRPVAINSIFCTICLDTLSNVYSQAYTIFNLMSAMWN
uniref:Odorant receptor n=1 Tax=Dendrolimus houi TaxID=765132 RepID=A0A076E7K0_9NEOP|nr:odorant receptor [Dendrolimus houi]